MTGQPPVGVVVLGAEGRMGRFACALLEASREFRVACRVGRTDDLERALADADAPLGL